MRYKDSDDEGEPGRDPVRTVILQVGPMGEKQQSQAAYNHGCGCKQRPIQSAGLMSKLRQLCRVINRREMTGGLQGRICKTELAELQQCAQTDKHEKESLLLVTEELWNA